MTPSLEMILGAAVLAALLVFMAAFRFALREGTDASGGRAIPRAQVLPGKGGTMRLVQAGFVALAITSVFVMIVCALGIVGLAIAG